MLFTNWKLAAYYILFYIIIERVIFYAQLYNIKKTLSSYVLFYILTNVTLVLSRPLNYFTDATKVLNQISIGSWYNFSSTAKPCIVVLKLVYRLLQKKKKKKRCLWYEEFCGDSQDRIFAATSTFRSSSAEHWDVSDSFWPIIIPLLLFQRIPVIGTW